jgi:tetratricopeptide (TPR) repeat protein
VEREGFLVSGRFHTPRPGLGQYTVLVVLAVVLLAVIGLGGYVAGWHLWGTYHLRAARQALERRDFTPAREHLARCLRAWPGSAETHLLAAQAARRAGAYEDAEQHLDECKRLQGASEAASLERLLLCAQRGDLARAERYLLHCVKTGHPDTVLILEALAQGYLKTFHLHGAIHCLTQWLEREPGTVPALLWRGQANELLRRYSEALPDYRQAVEHEPENTEARLRLAALLTHFHLPQEAIVHYEEVRRRQPQDPNVLLGLARCRRELGEREEARQLLDTLLAEHPHDGLALCERGKLAQEAGQTVEAEDWFRQAVARAPYERDTVYALYRCLVQNGKQEEADKYLARLRAIDADLERLKAVAREVVETPRDPSLRYEAGTILLRNGQDQEGLRWLTSVLHEDPRHQPTHQALADYYERVGKADLAAQHRRLGSGP